MAESSSSVLITGESGTGKEMFAQAIHNSSPRRDFRFVAVNCGALPESLLESELFGYDEGAFTGARKGGKPGLFELAHRGTLFLDEIGEMPPSLQMRLLRVLEERQVMRLGGAGLIGVDIRVIAASNRDLGALVERGEFREDLYYRLAVLPLDIPPLRERREDILPLVDVFRRLFGFSFTLAPEVGEFFVRARWRGNARELRNTIEFIANLGVSEVNLQDLPGPSPRLRAEERSSGAPAEPGDVPRGCGESGDDRQSCVRAFLLEELAAAAANGTRLGRRSLRIRAAGRLLFCSEREIRAALAGMEREGLVIVRPGRGGTVVTPGGLRAAARAGAGGYAGGAGGITGGAGAGPAGRPGSANREGA